MPDEITNAIASDAAGPKRVQEDGLSVEQFSLQEKIEADRYLASKQAMKNNPRMGIRFSKLVPPGTD